MEVSGEGSTDNTEPEGQELFQTLVSLSGLPEGLIQPELFDILDNHGQNPSELTLVELRHAMVAYLEKIHQEVAQNSPVE